MSIYTIFRNDININLFRDLIITSLAYGVGNNAILCSGFFQEKKITRGKEGKYRASLETGFLNSLKNIDITLIGVHNAGWQQSYANFCKEIRSNAKSLTAKYPSSFNWHAKIYILKKDTIPVFAIIGSSNLTSRAFGSNTSPSQTLDAFNYECDVVICNDLSQGSTTDGGGKNITAMCDDFFNNNSPNAYLYIKTKYIQAENKDLSIENRLRKLEEQMDIGNLKDFDFTAMVK